MKVQTGDLKWKEIFLKPAGDTLPVGSITEFGGSIIPTNWLKCDGSLISRATYPQLFKVIGTSYGVGDGSTTFKLPTMESENAIVIIKAKNSIGAAGTVVEDMDSSKHDDVPNAKAVRNYVKEHGLIVSPTEPTTGEEVWIKKSNNIFNLLEMLGEYSSASIIEKTSNSVVLKGAAATFQYLTLTKYLKAGTYAFQKKWDLVSGKAGAQTGAVFITKASDSSSLLELNTSTRKGTFTINEDMTIKIVIYLSIGTALTEATQIEVYDIQLEQGPTATEFEEYVDKEIYVKNDNGAYDKFYDETNLENYSTEEQRIGTWINGKPLYRKVISFGALNNASLKGIAHNISKLETMVTLKGYATNGNSFLPLPFVYENDSTKSIRLYADKTSIYIASGADRTTFNAYVTLEYTKTE
jgi:hypothetical protein